MSIHTGRLLKSFFHEIKEYLEQNSFNYNLSEFIPYLMKSFGRLQQVTSFLASKGLSDPDEAAGASVDYLKMFSLVVCSFPEITLNEYQDILNTLYLNRISNQ